MVAGALLLSSDCPSPLCPPQLIYPPWRFVDDQVATGMKGFDKAVSESYRLWQSSKLTMALPV